MFQMIFKTLYPLLDPALYTSSHITSTIYIHSTNFTNTQIYMTF